MNSKKRAGFFILFSVIFLCLFFHCRGKVELAEAAMGGYPIVKFNGVDAEVVSHSDTGIKAKVPSGASTGPVSVETEDGNLQFSDIDFEVDTPHPAPSGLSAKASVGSIEITWDPPVSEDVIGYNLYRAESENGAYTVVEPDIADAFFIDESKGLAIGKAYYYKTSAVYADGKESDKSLPASALFGTLSIWIPNVNGAQEKNAGKAVSSSKTLLKVPVNVENADKLAMGEVEIYIDYDSSLLKPDSVEKTILSVDYEWVLDTFVDGTVKISIKKAVNKQLIGVGTLFNVVFEIQDSAKEGQTVDFTFHDDSLSPPSSIKNPNGKSIPLHLANGALKIQRRYRKGDVNGDAKIQASDSSAAFVYSAGILEPAQDPLAGGDIDGDSVIMTNDAGLILYYVVNSDWPSLKDIKVFQKDRTVDLGTKTLTAKLIDNSQLTIYNLQLETASRPAKAAKKRYLEVPIYLSALDDVNSGQFDIAYPPDILKASAFTLDAKMKKNFDSKTEFKKKGLAVVSVLYNKKGRALIGQKRTQIGVLKFEVLADKAASGKITFSRVNLYDRFGRDFARSSLQMNIEKKDVTFNIAAGGGGKKSMSHGLMDSLITLSPTKGKVGDIITISGDFAVVLPDTTPPATTASPPGGILHGPQTITLACDDGTGSGCNDTYYTLDGSDPQTSPSVFIYSQDPNIFIDFDTTLKYYSDDNEGNFEDVKTEVYTIVP
ncbi:MAG: chitobiase/beta-hexosaminidase C-terminal domain-containing protein [Nitrospinae bacterium]|nr:chitobiase/beta-hexosaminidase C-terminal domain-containing protein [Nitrospinota bacterium]